MLVVDRREDESAYPLGANRSEAQREPHDLSQPSEAELLRRGVLCVSSTPGPFTLLKILLARVWGVSYPSSS
jgi:hypothetical protein